MFSEIFFTFIWQKLLAELFADALQPFLAAPDRDAELLGNLQMRCSFQRDAAEQTIVLRRQQGADGVEQLVDRAERPVLHGEFFALLRKILLERDEVQGLQRPAAAADADLVLERLHQPGLRLCMAHERVLLADSLEEGLLHGLFGVGGIEKEVLGVDIQPFIICIVQRFQKGIGLHALHQPLCGRMAAGSGCASGLHRTAPERDILCGTALIIAGRFVQCQSELANRI
jgi:hypothetical protein